MLITVSSGAILQGGGAGLAAYAVSKGAVRQSSELLAEEVKGYDIRVFCLMPGTMDTAANRDANDINQESFGLLLIDGMCQREEAVMSAMVPF